MLSADVLAVLLLACAGAAAGATWVVDGDGGAGVDYTTIQAAVDAAAMRSSTPVIGDCDCVSGSYFLGCIEQDGEMAKSTERM